MYDWKSSIFLHRCKNCGRWIKPRTNHVVKYSWDITMAFDKKEYDKEYQHNHRTQANEARKRWAEKHPEKSRKLNTEAHRRWRETNKDKWNAYMREYRRKKKIKEENG